MRPCPAMPRRVRDELSLFADQWDQRGVRAWHEGWWEVGRETGNLLAGIIHGFFCDPAERMISAGSIAKVCGEIGQHRFHYPGVTGGGGIMVKIYGQLQHD